LFSQWISKFLTVANARQSKFASSSSSEYTVAPDYEHTTLTPEGDFEPWDNYILDEDIVRLLRMLYKTAPLNVRFAQDPDRNPNLKYYFSAPYSVAALTLGYSACETFPVPGKQG
jgi:hypothetical protein